MSRVFNPVFSIALSIGTSTFSIFHDLKILLRIVIKISIMNMPSIIMLIAAINPMRTLEIAFRAGWIRSMVIRSKAK
jgi:hypothetical protein